MGKSESLMSSQVYVSPPTLDVAAIESCCEQRRFDSNKSDSGSRTDSWHSAIARGPPDGVVRARTDSSLTGARYAHVCCRDDSRGNLDSYLDHGCGDVLSLVVDSLILRNSLAFAPKLTI